MLIFKYLKVDNLNISMLRKGEVFFASPDELNDIHECKPQFIFNANKEVWSRFIYSTLIEVCVKLNLKPKSSLANEILSFEEDMLAGLLNNKRSRSLDHESLLNQFSSLFNDKAISELMYSDAVPAMRALRNYLHVDLEKKLNNSYYMTSFSKSATNLTMWGHYGDAEKGFALVYESNDGKINLRSDIEIFPSWEEDDNGMVILGDSKHCDAKLIDVTYKNKPVRANGFKNLVPNFFYSEWETERDYYVDLLLGLKGFDEKDIGSVKYTDWKYEKELRLHLPVHIELPPSFRSVGIDFKHIKGVIFGSRTSATDKDKILSACYYLKESQDEGHELYVFEASSFPGQYKIKITAIGKVSDVYGKRIPLIERFNQENKDLKKKAESIAEIINAS